MRSGVGERLVTPMSDDQDQKDRFKSSPPPAELDHGWDPGSSRQVDEAARAPARPGPGSPSGAAVAGGPRGASSAPPAARPSSAPAGRPSWVPAVNRPVSIPPGRVAPAAAGGAALPAAAKPLTAPSGAPAAPTTPSVAAAAVNGGSAPPAAKPTPTAAPRPGPASNGDRISTRPAPVERPSRPPAEVAAAAGAPAVAPAPERPSAVPVAPRPAVGTAGEPDEGAAQEKVRPQPTLSVGAVVPVDGVGGREGNDADQVRTEPTVPVGAQAPAGGSAGAASEGLNAAAPPEAAQPAPPEAATAEPAPPEAAAAEPAPEPEAAEPEAASAPVAAIAPAAEPTGESAPLAPEPASPPRGVTVAQGAPPEGSLAPSSAPPDALPGGRRSRWGVVGVAAAAALAVAAGIWFTMAGAPEPALEAAAEGPAAEERGAVEPAKQELSPPGQASAAPSAQAAPVEPEPVEPEPVASASASAEAVAAEPETLRVRILVTPPTGRIVEKGKKVGHSGVEVEVTPGKKRVFEIQHDGYTARRLVVDGSEPEIHIGLRPSAGALAPPAPDGQAEVTAPPAAAVPTAKTPPPSTL